VQAARAQYLTSQWFADQGFAVVVIDGRGTPGRGSAWERAVHLDLAGPVLDDQVDGLLAAAEAGLVAYGYELNPILCLISKIRCWKYRQQIHIYWGNFWKVDFPPQTIGIYVFLLDRFMVQLGEQLEQQAGRLQRPLKVVSYTFQIPGRKPTAQKGALFAYIFELSEKA
jgi:hypothetical protein